MGKMIMIDQNQIETLNESYKNATPSEIIKKAFELNAEAVVTTNFRPYEAAILHAVNKVVPKTTVVWCDTGYNTPQTYRHAEKVISDLDLKIHLYVPKQTSAHRNVVLGIPSVDAPELSLIHI